MWVIQRVEYFFYGDDGLVPSIQSEWLQWVFDILMGMFDQVGLKKNVGNTVGVAYHNCHIIVRHSKKSYGQCITREGPTYLACQRQCVWFQEFTAYLASGSLAAHRQNSERFQIWYSQEIHPPPTPTDTNIYHVYLLKSSGSLACLMEGCHGREDIQTNLWVHFAHCHMQDTMVILEEVERLNPRMHPM